MKLVPCTAPEGKIEKVEGIEPCVLPNGRTFVEFVGEDGEVYEQCTTKAGQVSWLRLFHDGDER